MVPGSVAAASDTRLYMGPDEVGAGVYGVHNIPGCAFGSMMLRHGDCVATRASAGTYTPLTCFYYLEYGSFL